MAKTIRAGGLLGSFVIVLVASSLLVAQDAKKADAKKGPQNRLPSNYGKLDLSDMQREKILGIQTSYAPKIDELEAQLAAVKAKQKSEIEAVLKPEQLKKLTDIRAAAKAKADAAKEAKAKETKEAPKASPAVDAKKAPEKK